MNSLYAFYQPFSASLGTLYGRECISGY